MKLNRFLKRHLPCFRQYSVPNIAGARSTHLYKFGDRTLRPFKGYFTRHRLILMRIGSVAMAQGGRTYLAGPGDALLVPAGEGCLSFVKCPQVRGVQAEILEFDHRTLAPLLRNSAAWETLALEIDDTPMGAVPLPGLVAQITALDTGMLGGGARFRFIMGQVFGQFWRGLPQFVKADFYLPRWRLGVALERVILLPNGITHLGAEYPGGAKQLRKDCLVFLGAEPAAIVAQRRCDLATAWLRCGHSIEDVGKALGYSSQWEFESAYSGRMRQRCADAQAMPALETLEPEELAAVIRPHWWLASGPSRVEIPKAECALGISASEWAEIRKDCAASLDLQKSMDARRAAAKKRAEAEDVPPSPNAEAEKVAPPQEPEPTEDLVAQRARVADELREKAKDFFAMKSTGAEIIVPIFGHREIVEAMAA